MIGPGNGPVGGVAGPEMGAPQPGDHDPDETDLGTDPETDSAVD
jgi:hypothetical protein